MGKLACSRLQDSSAARRTSIGLAWHRLWANYSRYKVQNYICPKLCMYFQIAVRLYLKVQRLVFVLHVIVFLLPRPVFALNVILYLFLIITDKVSA